MFNQRQKNVKVKLKKEAQKLFSKRSCKNDRKLFFRIEANIRCKLGKHPKEEKNERSRSEDRKTCSHKHFEVMEARVNHKKFQGEASITFTGTPFFQTLVRKIKTFEYDTLTCVWKTCSHGFPDLIARLDEENDIIVAR